MFDLETRGGVRLFFAMDAPLLHGVGALGLGFGGFSGSSDGPSTESLILAQDERWRRA